MGVAVVPGPTMATLPHARRATGSWRESRRRSKRALDTSLVALELHPQFFRCCWLVILLLHAVSATILAFVAVVYFNLTRPYLSYLAGLLKPNARLLFLLCSTIYSMLSVAHAAEAVWMAYHSALFRRLGFGNAVHEVIRAESILATEEASLPRIASPLRPRNWWKRLFGRQGVFGAESRYFELRFLLREVLEVASQTVQVFWASQLIGSKWVNDLYVGLHVVNCFSTMLIQLYTHHHAPALERVLCLLVDLFLDSAMSFVLPLVIFAPYFHAYDPDQYTFDIALLFDDVWFANLIRENQQVFVTNGMDLVVKLLPQISILLCLNSIKNLIMPRRHKAHQWTGSRRFRATQHDVLAWRHQREHEMARSVLSRRWVMLLHVLFAVTGVVTLVAHLLAHNSASALTEIPGCKQALYPWFATKPACSVFEFNCYRRNTTTVSVEALDAIVESTLAVLVVSHCPALHLPAAFAQFHALIGLEVYNSSLVSWSDTAAVLPTTFPQLLYVTLALTNMSTFPSALLGPLPPWLTDIEFSMTNLTSLPKDLHERWPPMASFYFEFSKLDTFPTTLLSMQVDDLSLIGNQIKTVPSLPTFSYFTLSLSRNPIETLSERGATIGILGVEFTEMPQVQEWVAAAVQQQAFLYGSPACDNQHEQGYAPLPVAFTCHEKDERGDGRYPLQIMIPMRQP